MLVCKECNQQIYFSKTHSWQHVNIGADSDHKALPKYTTTTVPISDATGFAGETENIKSVPDADKDAIDKAQAKMQAMKFLALNQLELNYRLAAITGLIIKYEDSTNMEIAIDSVLRDANVIAKAAIAKWHGDMIGETKIMMEGVE